MSDASRFADELRRWRTRQGVSQLELSIRAGTTQRHVSYLENARSAPSRSMVLRLAESLELSLRDRNTLLLACGYAPVYPESDLDGPALRPVRDALDVVLAGHEPFPAIAARSDGVIVAANGAFEVLTEGADDALLRPPVNGYRLALDPRGMAPRVRNLPEWGRHVLEALRARLRRSPDERLEALLAELAPLVPDAAIGPAHLGFAVPLQLTSVDGQLSLMTTLTTFATAVDVTLAELHLEAFLPTDDATTDILHRRAARRAGST